MLDGKFVDPFLENIVREAYAQKRIEKRNINRYKYLLNPEAVGYI